MRNCKFQSILMFNFKQSNRQLINCEIGLLVAIIFLFSGCIPLELRSTYDAFTDEQIMQFYADLTAFIATIERGSLEDFENFECEYNYHSDFYLESQVKLNILITRNLNRPDNEIILQGLGSLQKNLSRMEKSHRSHNCRAVEELVRTYQDSLNPSVGAIIFAEQLRKRGLRASRSEKR